MKTYTLRIWERMAGIDKITIAHVVLIFLFWSLYAAQLKAQIVINEVFPGGTVEIKNIGNTAVPVGDYWLCDFPDYVQIKNSNSICGNLMLGAGEILSVDDFNVVSNLDGEMGLYSTSSFGSASAILDYVEWGSAGHTRASVAIAAGIWSADDFAPAFASNQSLAYDGTGESAADWTAGNSTICAENNTGGCDVVVGNITLADGSVSTSICVDGNADPLDVITSGGTIGVSTGWIITDADGTILALPAGPPFDLDGAGIGTCEIWYIRYEDDSNFGGNDLGNNISDLTGCFALSNQIDVIREAPDGGLVSFTDGSTFQSATAGNVIVEVEHTTSSPNLSYWYIITDINDHILGFANSANGNTLDLSGAPVGECHIWGWNYRGLGDPVMGDHISSLADDDCEAISENWLRVNRQPTDCEVVVGDITLADGSVSTSICVDGNGDPLEVITSGGTTGISTGWIITDSDGTILALPAGPPFDLDGAGIGTCEIWYIRYEDDGNFGGNDLGNNIKDLTGCYAISNPIDVIREAPDGGLVSFTDGSTFQSATAGNVMVEVEHTTSSPNLSYWYIITDINDHILGFANSANGNTLDLSGAPIGECHIWGWNYRGLGDPVMGDHISSLADDDCEAISENWLRVNRQPTDCEVVVGDIALADGIVSTSICVDGNGDPLEVITSGGTTGISTGWIITDSDGTILALPAGPPFDLDGAGIGTCEIWYIRYEDDGNFGGNDLGNNIKDLTGCYAISNPIDVIREAPDGGLVSFTDGSTFQSATAGNAMVEVTHTTSSPNLSYWYIITDINDHILGFANSANGNTLDLSGAPVGECHIWGWNYRGLGDPVMGDHISSLADDDCEAISENWLRVNRQPTDCEVVVGDITLADGSVSTSICVDGNGDPLEVITSGGTTGISTGWIITDADGTILALPAGPPFDLDGAGIGTCEIWYIRYEDDGNFGGNDLGNNIKDLTGCYAISNPIDVIREAPDGGTVTLLDGSTSYAQCAGNIVFDVTHTTAAPNLSYWYIITDANDNILAWLNSADGNTLDLSAAPAGECHVWGWNYRGLGDPIVGDHISTLADDDCEDITDDWITVYREVPDGGTVTLLDGSTSYAQCAGNIVFDVTHTTTAPNLSYWYIITDANDNILEWVNSADGNTLDLSAAPAGECHVWGWNYRGLADPIVGENISTLADDDCEDITDDWITVYREIPDGGTVDSDLGTDITICIDDTADPINVSHITTAPNLSYWYIITDDNDNILDWSTESVIDLNGAGVGDCRIWGWNYRGLADPVVGESVFTLDDDDCESLSTNFIAVSRVDTGSPCTTSSIDISSVSQFNVYPNPASDFVQIEFDGLIGDTGELTLIDLSGRALQLVNITQQQKSSSMDVSNLAAGIYHLRIASGAGVSIQKLVLVN